MPDIVCGAIGYFDRETVDRIASHCGLGLSPAHRSRRAILFTDKPPARLKTGASMSRGYLWGSLNDPPPGRQPDWKTAAREGFNGLVTGPRETFLFTCESNTPALFWMRDPERSAVYFCNRIDPMVRAVARLGRVSPDWDCWADLLTVGFPTANRTPFAQVRRLNPDQRLVWTTKFPNHSHVALRREAWEWAKVVPDLSLEEGLEGLDVALQAAFERMPDNINGLLLSGGLDSRVVAAYAAQRWPGIRTVTTNVDEGSNLDEQIAARVSAHLGLENVYVDPGSPAEYREQRVLVALWSDYVRPAHPWLLNAFESVARSSDRIVYGFGETMIQNRIPSRTDRLVDISGKGNVGAAVWRRVRQKRAWAFKEPFTGNAGERTLRGFREVAKLFADHPRRYPFTVFRTFGINGLCSWHSAMPPLLGSRLATPFMHGDVIRAMLRIDPEQAIGAKISMGLQELRSPGLSKIPSTRLRPRPPADPRPIRRASPEVTSFYTGLLADSPLRPVFSDELERALTSDGISAAVDKLGPKGFYGVEAIVNFELWRHRYADILDTVDPAPLIDAQASAVRSG